jgi:ethanolaminephosphotransferase
MIPEYKYQVIDNSILTPVFKDRVVKPFIRFIPWWLPANIITVGSNIFMIGALLIALFEFSTITVRFISSAILIMLYAIGDHLDGMQAKRTKTSSALGEFFDHFLDAFNTGILLLTVLTLFGITNPGVFAFVLLTSYLAHASMVFEQYKTGWLIFDKIGSLEALLFTFVLLLLSSIPSVFGLLTSTLFLNLKVIEVLVLSTAIGSLSTLFTTIFRAHIAGFRFYFFCGMLIFTAIFSFSMFSNVVSSFIITLYAGYFMGNLMRGHLADGIERMPDIVAPLILATGFFAGISTFPYFIVVLFLYFFLVIIRLITGTIFTLRAFWVWKNPSIEDTDYQPYTARS